LRVVGYEVRRWLAAGFRGTVPKERAGGHSPLRIHEARIQNNQTGTTKMAMPNGSSNAPSMPRMD
jgi:hypothetical protein